MLAQNLQGPGTVACQLGWQVVSPPLLYTLRTDTPGSTHCQADGVSSCHDAIKTGLTLVFRPLHRSQLIGARLLLPLALPGAAAVEPGSEDIFQRTGRVLRPTRTDGELADKISHNADTNFGPVRLPHGTPDAGLSALYGLLCLLRLQCPASSSKPRLRLGSLHGSCEAWPPMPTADRGHLELDANVRGTLSTLYTAPHSHH